MRRALYWIAGVALALLWAFAGSMCSVPYC